MAKNENTRTPAKINEFTAIMGTARGVPSSFAILCLRLQNFLADILFDVGFIYPVFDLIKLKTKPFGHLWITHALKVSQKNDIELTSA